MILVLIPIIEMKSSRIWNVVLKLLTILFFKEKGYKWNKEEQIDEHKLMSMHFKPWNCA